MRLRLPDPAPSELPTGGSPHAPPTPGAPPAAPPAPASAGDDAEPPSPPKWLPMRLQQAERAQLKKLGFESLEQAQARLAKAKEIEDQEEAKRLANLSELEREKAQRATLEAQLVTERKSRETAEAQSRLVAACATAGVKNVSYAQFMVDSIRKAEPSLTEAEALARLTRDETQRGALGLVTAPPAPAPITTGPAGGGTPPTPTPSPTPGGEFNAATATPAEWTKWRKENGIL